MSISALCALTFDFLFEMMLMPGESKFLYPPNSMSIILLCTICNGVQDIG